MEFENMEIGKEQNAITPKKCKVLDFEIKEVKDKENKDLGKKVVFKLEHPDRPEVMISKMKYEKNGKLVESGIWLNEDSDKKIAYNSALANLMRFYLCKKITDFRGMVVDTTTDDNGYLIIKGY